jgi:hypothetical protein
MNNKLVEWLKGRGQAGLKILSVRPVKVTIKGEEFHGAHVKQEYICDTVGAAAYGQTVNEEYIYLLGEIPKCRQKRQSLCFRFVDDERDWYLSGGYSRFLIRYSRQEYKPFDPEYRPFGDFFMLQPWSSPDGTNIDTYERYLYVRVGAILEYV